MFFHQSLSHAESIYDSIINNKFLNPKHSTSPDSSISPPRRQTQSAAVSLARVLLNEIEAVRSFHTDSVVRKKVTTTINQVVALNVAADATTGALPDSAVHIRQLDMVVDEAIQMGFRTSKTKRIVRTAKLLRELEIALSIPQQEGHTGLS